MDEAAPRRRGVGVIAPAASFDRPEVVDAYRGRTRLTPAEEALFRRWIRPGAAVLDLGIGAGRTTGWLAAWAGTYVGIDIAASMVDEARSSHPGLDLRVGDAADLSELATGSFDAVVFSFNGIDYLGDLDRARCLVDIRRVLSGDGVVILSRHSPRAVLAAPPDGGGTVGGLARAAVGSLVRTARLVPTRAFWSGEGWIHDPAQGGLDTHHSTRRRTIAELRRHGFEPVDLVNGDLPRSALGVRTPWWYHVARRA